IQAAMQRTEVGSMRLEAERACQDTTYRVYRLHDLIDGQFLRAFPQHEAAMQTALRLDQAAPDERLQDLGEVRSRDMRSIRNLLGSLRIVRVGHHMHDSAQGVFGGLRDHHDYPFRTIIS